jgi:hypothetical protein
MKFQVIMKFHDGKTIDPSISGTVLKKIPLYNTN